MPSVFVLSAIEFGSVWMLGWLAAAGIPLALHLLHRRRQQEINWAAMELLLQAIQQNSRTVRIEGWLLLLLRTLALLLLAIALARPLWLSQTNSGTSLSQPPRLWVIVLDASYSMGYTSGRQSLWQQAQTAATELVSQASPNDAFLLIQLSEPSQAIISQPSFDAQRVSAEILGLKCSDGGGDLNSCLEILRQTLRESESSLPKGIQPHVVFYTDMGEDSWQPATREPLKKELRELSSRYQVQIESLAPQQPQNLALSALEADSVVIFKDRPFNCTATIHNYSTTAANRVPVQFQTEGVTQQTEFVDCPPGQARQVVVQLKPGAQATWSIAAVLPDDRLQVDNRRDLIVSVKSQIRVATIEDTSGAARLINLSLAPGSTEAISSPNHRTIAVETWSTFDLQSRSLNELSAVILADVAELSASAIAKLKSYVESGGNLLVMAGPRTSPTAWNEATGLSGLVGLKLQEPANPSDWRIDPLNYSSPIARPFANFPDAGLLTTPVFRYWKTTSAQPDSSRIQVDLAFDSGDPFLARAQLGEGAVAVLLSAPQSGSNATDDSANWNAIATWPSFVPIMQKTLETLVGNSEGQLNLLVGQPLRGATISTAPALELLIQRPDNAQSRLAVPTSSSNRRSWIYAGTDRAGIYQVRVNEAGIKKETASESSAAREQLTSSRLFAVNIQPEQSNLLSLNVAALELATGPATSTPELGGNDQLAEHRPNEWLAHVCLWGCC